MSNLVSKNVWDSSYRNTALQVPSKADTTRLWVEKYMPPARGKTCIEIGCYPGRYLSVFGDLGYELYGIDFAERLGEVPGWLNAHGYKIGKFWMEDFMNTSFERRFDVVSSFGFIEHFSDWDLVLRKHAELVEPGGYLVVSVPNFLGGFQNWFHRNFNKETYMRHNVDSMDVERWIEILEEYNFKILYGGYFGSFYFFGGGNEDNVADKLIVRLLQGARPFLRRLLPKDRRLYSPYGGVIAQRQ